MKLLSIITLILFCIITLHAQEKEEKSKGIFYDKLIKAFEFESKGARLDEKGKTIKAGREFDKSRPLFDEIFKLGSIIKSTAKCKFIIRGMDDSIPPVRLEYSCAPEQKDFSFPNEEGGYEYCSLNIWFHKEDLSKKMREEFEDYFHDSLLDGSFEVKEKYETRWKECNITIQVKPKSIKLFSSPQKTE